MGEVGLVSRDEDIGPKRQGDFVKEVVLWVVPRGGKHQVDFPLARCKHVDEDAQAPQLPHDGIHLARSSSVGKDVHEVGHLGRRDPQLELPHPTADHQQPRLLVVRLALIQIVDNYVGVEKQLGLGHVTPAPWRRDGQV